MKKLILLLAIFTANRLLADDTAELQALINAGNTTLPAHHRPYTITTLNLVHNLNANGNTIRCTLPDDYGITMNMPGIRLSNAILVGMDDASNPSGASGIAINADNDTVTYCDIRRFPAYGILGGDGNAPVITHTKIADIGYSGMFIVSNRHSLKGGVVAWDTFDRSMLSAQTVTEGALMLRGTKAHTSSGWRVYKNVFLMPFLPKDITAECFELRYAPYSIIEDNTCIGGSIGISVVRNDYVKTVRNRCSRQSQEGIEYADSGYGMIRDNIITDQAGMGLLVDGFAPLGCSHDSLYRNTISNCHSHGVQIFKDAHDIELNHCLISTATKAVNIQGASGVTLKDCELVGNGGNAVGLFLDNSEGKVTMKGGSMKGFSHKFYIYANKPVTTDDVVLEDVSDKGNKADFDQNLSGGASAGHHIQVRRGKHRGNLEDE